MANGGQCELAIDFSSNTTAPEQANGSCEDNGNTRGDGGSTEETAEVSSNHESIVSVDFDLLWRLRKYLVLLGTLAVTVTYNAGLTPPGAFWGDNKGGHEAGHPVLRARFFTRYQVFFYCNATAFAASLVLIILLLSKHVSRQKLWLRSIQFTMVLDLFSLMGAYAAGSCRAVKSSIYIWVLVLAVFLYTLIHILVSTRVVPKELKEKMKSKLRRILPKKWDVHVCCRGSRQEKDVEGARKFILMLVIFAASVTYQAGLSPPGGFWNQIGQNKHPAMSILRSKHLARYNFFVSCNSTSFVASLVTIILLLSPDLSRHGIRCKAVYVCVVVDLLGLIGAYAAGSSRSLATSFCIVVIPVVVWICFGVVTGFLVQKPVAQWLKENKPNILSCMHRVGRVFSLEFDHPITGNREQENSVSSVQQSPGLATGATEQENAFKQEHQHAYNNRFPSIEEDESHGEHHPGNKLQMSNAEDSVSDSDHKAVNHHQSENTNPATDCQSAPKEAISKSGNLQFANTQKQASSIDEVKITNGRHDMSIPEHQSTNTQHIANMNGQTSSANDLSPTVVPVEDSSDVTILASDCNGVTNNITVEKEYSDVLTRTTEIEVVRTDDDTGPFEIGNIDNNERVPSQYTGDENGNRNPTDEHLHKSRTYLLLLAILAVSLAYQSGLNPPGGFWSKKENNNSIGIPVHKGIHHRPYHMPGDPILEDTHHRRYIAFFYLNAIAFVASLVMIIMLLNLRVSKKVLKRYALQIVMIVDLLALTGSYVMGSCRRTKNSIYSSLLVGLVIAYVVVHVLIAIHVIPKGWKQLVTEKLDNLWPHLPPLGQGHTQRANEKEWERRRNLLLTLAVLAATVTYQAGMNPPGGVWSDDKDASGKPGDPILEDNNFKRYNVFYYSNTFAFVSSVVITILLVNKKSCEHGIKSYALRVCLVVGLVGLLIAYSAGSCRKAKESIYLIIIAAAVLMSLVIQVRLLSSTHDTHEGRAFKCIESLLELLVGKEDVSQKTIAKCKSSSHHGKTDRKKHKYLMLLAILAASITYQAGLNPPGGTWPDDVAGNPVLMYKDGHVAGNPVLLDIHPRRYKVFFWFNSISLMTSIVVIMFLLNKSMWKKDVPLGVLQMFMVLNLLALMTAFAAGSCRKFRTSVYVYALVVGVVIYLVIVIFLSVFYAKYLKPVKRSGISSESHHGGDALGTEQLIPEQQV